MRKLGERMLQCKPLIPQIKTSSVPQKRTRMSDTDDNHFRIGTFDLFHDSYDNDDYRVVSTSVFSDSDDSPMAERPTFGDEHPPPFRLEEPRMYRKITSRTPRPISPIQEGLPAVKLAPQEHRRSQEIKTLER